MPLIEANGDLFSKLHKKSIATHACNSYGVWGKGIALGFKSKFPMAFKEHKKACKTCHAGDAQIFQDPAGLVGCLITSTGYAPPDSPNDIMHNTKRAVGKMLTQVAAMYPGHEIHSNLFNSGLFQVPWRVTKSALIEAMEESGLDVTWRVWRWSP